MKKPNLTITTLGSLFVLSAVCMAPFSATAADLLYQWQEADGSLTFSPTPPPEGSGIDFKVIKTTGKTTGIESESAESSHVTTTAEALPEANPSTEILNGSRIAKLEYTPQSNTASTAQRIDLPTGISQDLQPAATYPVTSEVTPNLQTRNEIATHANTQADAKGKQCNRLRKRITSLEYVMASSTDNKTMDETVVQIGRYQHSYNQHCLN